MKKRQYTKPTMTAIPGAEPQLLTGSKNGATDWNTDGGAGSSGGKPSGPGTLAKEHWGYDPTWGQEDEEEY